MKFYYFSSNTELDIGGVYNKDNGDYITIYRNLLDLVKDYSYITITTNENTVYEVNGFGLSSYPNRSIVYAKNIEVVKSIDIEKYIVDNFELFNKENLSIVLSAIKIPERFLEKHYDRILNSDNLHIMLQYQVLSEAFLEKHYQHIKDSIYLYECQKVSVEFLQKHYYDISYGQFHDIYRHQKVSVEFIKNDINFVHWDQLAKNKNVSESIFDTFYDFLDPYILLDYQDLSETFLEKHYHELPNSLIWMYQNVSAEFVQKHISDIDEEDMEMIENNRNSNYSIKFDFIVK